MIIINVNDILIQTFVLICTNMQNAIEFVKDIHVFKISSYIIINLFFLLRLLYEQTLSKN